ncbi:MAG: ATP-binding cassette domain-containing protein [Chloroflexi bacterium]|nr:ATP-binding cassette domain-containing protein [Chloroflexota bacterium]
MAPSIVVEHLSRYYRVYRKQPGLLGSLRGLVHRQYADVRAVDDVSFTIEQGELVGFLGPNGAGKTTTLKVLAGLLHPSAGQVAVLGFTPWRREAALQRQFTLVMGQKSQLWWDLPPIESYLLNQALYDIPEPTFRETLAELADLLDLEPLLHIQVRKLSLGERMKCELAAALLHRPRVLFLDEPTIGLDVVMQKKMRDFVRAYNQRYQATVLLTSHYMDDVKELCDRVLIVNHGKLVYDGRLEAIVARYADHRVLVAAFEAPVARQALAELGEVLAWDPLRATLRLPRAAISERAALLLERFPVADLAIQEPQVEDVIRQVFGEA